MLLSQGRRVRHDLVTGQQIQPQASETAFHMDSINSTLKQTWRYNTQINKSLKPITTESGRSDTEGMLKVPEMPHGLGDEAGWRRTGTTINGPRCLHRQAQSRVINKVYQES